MPSDKKRDYQIGRGKPPVHSRFQKGKSGNPSGRSKDKKQLPDLKSAMTDALSERVTITENGVVRQITKFEAICKQLINKAASGHVPTIKVLLPFLAVVGAGDPNSEVDLTDAVESLNCMIETIAKRHEAEAAMEKKTEQGGSIGGRHDEPTGGRDP